MPVLNSEKYIKESVNSILDQNFTDFEFIIIDDASTDRSMNILDSIIDKRIIKIRNNVHVGNFRCRNQGLKIAKGKYICVMDSDDISHSERLKRQYDFMESNSEFVAAGTFVERFNAESSSIWKFNTKNEQLKIWLLHDSVYCHPSLIFRKEVCSIHNIKYNESYYYAGDYDLMVNLSRIGVITNMDDVLLKYRIHPSQITSSKRSEQINFADYIRLKQLALLKIRPSLEETMMHLRLVKFMPISQNDLTKAENWLNKLLTKNRKLMIYDEEFLYKFLYLILKKAIQFAF
jgi:glycosyltransferase involved in cell wall biosynthesis